ncbi:MAG TPA: hypothetical protein VF070_13800 [Streptosporangiaceae bacterium]
MFAEADQDWYSVGARYRTGGKQLDDLADFPGKPLIRICVPRRNCVIALSQRWGRSASVDGLQMLAVTFVAPVRAALQSGR